MFAIRRELIVLALADPVVCGRLEGAKSIQEFIGILEDWCRERNIQVKHIEAST